MSARRRAIKQRGKKITVTNYSKNGTTNRGKTKWSTSTNESYAIREVLRDNTLENDGQGREVREVSEFQTFDVPNISDGQGDVKRSEIEYSAQTYAVKLVEQKENHVRVVGEKIR